jgi:pilus assembly protein FimV
MVRVRKLVLAIAAASALTSGMAHALGLGEISLKSSLNQPLDAEIELLEVRDLGNGEVLPSLAAVEEFNKVGVDRPYFLTDLKFTPVLKPNGKSVIRVTSSKPVREPYLNFLVEVLWPNGRLLREYTVLLDPPLYSPQTVVAATPRLPQAAPVTPRVASPAPVRRAEPAAPAAAALGAVASGAVASGAAAPSAAPAPLSDGQYRVGRDDTLWEIAERARPSGAVSVHQTMLAIQDLNPGAFFDGNINRLKSGQVLRLPNEQQIRSRSQADALAQVQAQNSAWREGRVVQPVATARQLDATRRSEAGNAPAEAPAADNLRLVSADAGKATRGSDNGAATDAQAALADKLALSQESLATSQRENQELKERLGDLQSQLDKLQRLIELKNEQLAKLQGGLAAEPAAASGAEAAQAEEAAESAAPSQPAAEVENAVKADGEVKLEAEEQPQAVAAPAAAPAAAPDASEKAPAAPAPVASAPAPAPAKPVAKPVAPVEEPSLVDEVLADPLLLAAGGGALALLAGLGLMINGRRKAQKRAVEEEGLFSDPAGEATAAAAPDELLDDKPAPAAPMPSMKGSDPLAEAEMYSSYGRFTQAAELLNNAINEEPQRADLRLKLMEVYAEMGDREGFVRQEAELGEIGGCQPQIDHLRARYPQILAGAAAIGGGMALVAATADGDVDAGAERGALSESAQSLDDEFLLDDLGLDSIQLDAPAPAAAAAGMDEGFDLSLDDLEAELERELAANPQPAGEAPLALDELTLDDDLLGLEPAAAESKPAADEGLSLAGGVDLDFDLELDGLELDAVEDAPQAAGAAPAVDDEFALELDAALAQEGVATAAAQAGDELFAELDQLGLDDALLAEVPTEAPAPAAAAAGDDELFAELDQLGLDDTLLTEAPVEAAVPLAADDGDLFAELDQLALDDGLLGEAAAGEAVAAAPSDGGEEEFLLDLAELDPVEPAASVAEVAAESAVAELQGLDELELELQELSTASEAEQDLDAAFDEFLSQSGIAEPAAQAELPSLADLEVAAVPELSGSEDFNFLADTDETATKLELARAYIDMGDADGARDILDEVLKEGSSSQQQEAREMMGRIA